ncbi:MAG: nucleotidyltransferase family protein [Candidatus Marinimicrobia bacterium]|nr:nucleotidyltransferase family protein [Candidatus Neomarinimicrobiota bacterium]MCH7764557.1 nucleotidyltransferase family protein [Candidatus Neomarinimicrobiota bacterium]
MKTFPFDTEGLIKICSDNDIVMVGLFGSIARGEGKENSDIDLLVKFAKRKSLLGVVKLERELSEAMGRKVDLVTEAAISPYIRKNVLRDLEIIYAAQ